MNLDGVVWKEDRMLWHDRVFRLEHAREDATWDGGDECFVFWKPRHLIAQYEQFWAQHPDFAPTTLFEVGVWFGGSAAFWLQALGLHRLVGIDIQKPLGTEYFDRYVAESKGRLKIYWDVDQADRTHLREIAQQDLPQGVDMVVDDGAHLYSPTLAAFEALFPVLRPGGFYFIEDWAWHHWPEYTGFRGRQPMTELAWQFVEAVGTRRGPIASVLVFPDFVVIERGSGPLGADFRLEALIFRDPTPCPQSLRALLRAVGREVGARARSWRIRSR